MNYKIFNKSSESMKEIKSKSIDLIFFSPPFNIGTRYNNFNDNLKLERYFSLMENVIRECARTLKKDGRLIIEIADSIYTNKKFIQLAGLIQKYAVVSAGMYLETRHINFARTKNNSELPDHGFDKNYSSSLNAHSNCNQILVFNKSRVRTSEGEILYFNYEKSKEHPCPEPIGIIKFIIKKYFKSGMTVLEPFMGTASFGSYVIKRGGFFFGYEIVKKFFNTAENKLRSIR